VTTSAAPGGPPPEGCARPVARSRRPARRHTGQVPEDPEPRPPQTGPNRRAGAHSPLGSGDVARAEGGQPRAEAVSAESTPHGPPGGPAGSHPRHEQLLVDRVEYPREALEGFDVATVPAPLTLFQAWLADVVAAELPEPNAATLATADERGRPSVRLVLVKSVDAQGARFYTNLGSRKGRELRANPHAALLFGWHALHRQIRMIGTAHLLPREQAEAYFATRPREAQIGAWASQQSQEVTRAQLDERVRQLSEHFATTDHIPMPDFWGGFLVVPDEVEFWVGRRSRLHDRIVFERRSVGGLDDAAAWRPRRLAP
jgi:pyridoxamine 5'-phosphate oxidase